MHEMLCTGFLWASSGAIGLRFVLFGKYVLSEINVFALLRIYSVVGKAVADSP